MSVLATQTQTAAPANNIVSFSRGNSDSSTPEALTSSSGGFLEKSILTISAVLNRENLEALYRFVSGRGFSQYPSGYRGYNHYKDPTCEYMGPLHGAIITTGRESDSRIGSKTIFSSAYTDPKKFLEAKINDTMKRLEAARENPEDVRLKEETLDALRTTMGVAYSEQNQAARDALSPEMQDNLATIGDLYCKHCGPEIQTFAFAVRLNQR